MFLYVGKREKNRKVQVMRIKDTCMPTMNNISKGYNIFISVHGSTVFLFNIKEQ